MSSEKYGVYIHVPFCVSKCRYCDFYSLGSSHSVPEGYIDALLTAWDYQRENFQLTFPPYSVYFGGGTPGLLTAEQISRILNRLKPAPDAEITLETNPELADYEKLCAFRQSGINRVSFGVQTANDSTLALLGRNHTSLQAAAALSAASRAGFPHICGDTMLALPGYSFQEFDDTLSLIAGNGANHISAYMLKIEPNTYFGRFPPEGLPDDDRSAEFYLYAVEKLAKQGFSQYEISNFARKGHSGKHNLLYWDCEDYLGLGPGAHSCISGNRFFYSSNLKAFLSDPLAVAFEGKAGVSDYIMLQLRLTRGLSLSLLRSRYGYAFPASKLSFLNRCAAQNYLEFDDDRVRLTPQGMLVQNSILCELLDSLD